MKLSLFFYRFFVLVLSFASINPIVISTLKISKALNNYEGKVYLTKRINNLPIYIQPLAYKILNIEIIYKRLKYNWPSIETGVYFIEKSLRTSLTRFLLLLLILIKKNRAILICNQSINLFLEKGSYTRQSRFFVFFVLFAFLSWILKLWWGFWNPGIGGWTMTYTKSLIPYEDFKLEGIKSNNRLECLNLKKNDLLSAIDFSKLPENNLIKKKSFSGDYLIETNYYLAKDFVENKFTLFSNGVFGFIFPSLPLNKISNKSINQTHIDIINLRLKNYKNFKGPFRIPFKLAYPSHTPYNKEFTKLVNRIDYLAYLNVIYKINLKTKIVSVLNFNVLSEYPKCSNK